MCRTADEDAPALTECFIDTIDLESHLRLFLKEIGLGHISAQDDVPVGELEVDRQSNGPPLGRKDNATYPTCSQIRVALVLRQSFERRMASSSPPAGCAVDVATGKSDRSGL